MVGTPGPSRPPDTIKPRPSASRSEARGLVPPHPGSVKAPSGKPVLWGGTGGGSHNLLYSHVMTRTHAVDNARYTIIEHMTNILLAVLIAELLAGFGAIVWSGIIIRRYIAAKEAEIRSLLAEFFIPEKEGQPSALAKWIQAASDIFGQSVAMQVKATLMGKRSGEVRAAAAAQGNEAISQAEGVGLAPLLEIGGLRRTLKKNPGLLDLALPFLGKFLGGSGQLAVTGNNGQSSDHPRFKFGA